METATETTADVARWLRCSRAKVYALARKHQIGMNLGGSAGWRFTHADKLALQRALRPLPESTAKPGRRPKRRRVA
jgi:hypothetical protein